MNQTAPAPAPGTSAPGASLLPDWIGAYTTAHFIWIAVLAVLALFVILWGTRLAARRKTAARDIRDYNATLTEEPRAPAQPRSFAPVPAAAPVPAPAAPPPPVSFAPPAQADSGPASGPVTQLKGLGPKVATRLAELGITTVGQIAALSDDQAAEIDAQLGAFRGRLTRDRWIEQARFLAAGDQAGFEAVFGRL